MRGRKRRDTCLDKKTRWDQLPRGIVKSTAEAAVRVAQGVPSEDVLSVQAALLVKEALRALQRGQWRVQALAQTRN